MIIKVTIISIGILIVVLLGIQLYFSKKTNRKLCLLAKAIKNQTEIASALNSTMSSVPLNIAKAIQFKDAELPKRPTGYEITEGQERKPIAKSVKRNETEQPV